MIKKEVRELCEELQKTPTRTQRFEEITDTLKRKYGFTAMDILNLFDSPPTITYGEWNKHLVLEND